MFCYTVNSQMRGAKVSFRGLFGAHFLVLLSLCINMAEACDVKLTEPLTKLKIENELLNRCTFLRARDIIAHLPDTYRSHFTFIRKSAAKRSSCVKPPFRPRIILFSAESALVIALPWDPDVADDGTNCNAVEFLELGAGAKEITASEKVFEPVPALVPTVLAKARKSEASCSSCHPSGTPMHGSYPDWEGGGSEAYGASDDKLVPGSQSAIDYARFYESIHRNGSAKLLIWPRAGSTEIELAIQDIQKNEVGSGSDNASFKETLSFFRNKTLPEMREYFRDLYSLPPYQTTGLSDFKGVLFGFRPNAILGRVLGVMESRRLFNEISDQPFFREIMLSELFLSYCFPSGMGIKENHFVRLGFRDLVLKRLLGQIMPSEGLSNLIASPVFINEERYQRRIQVLFLSAKQSLGIGRLISRGKKGYIDTSLFYNDGLSIMYDNIDLLFALNEPSLKEFVLKDAEYYYRFDNPLPYRLRLRDDYSKFGPPFCEQVQKAALRSGVSIEVR